jgi:hypothetical protein
VFSLHDACIAIFESISAFAVMRVRTRVRTRVLEGIAIVTKLVNSISLVHTAGNHCPSSTGL